MIEPTSFECLGCVKRIELKPGGWAFVYTQIVMHIDGCGGYSRPPRIEAAAITDRLFSAEPNPSTRSSRRPSGPHPVPENRDGDKK